MQRLIDQAKAALESGKSPTAILTHASFLPAHEWPRFRKLIRDSAQTPPLTIVSVKEPGESLTVTGRVVNGSGQPVKAAVMHFYQTSNKGWYSDRAAHVGGIEGDRKHARLFGYLKTDAEGRFKFATDPPGGLPGQRPSGAHSRRSGTGEQVCRQPYHGDSVRRRPAAHGRVAEAVSAEGLSLRRSQPIPRITSASRSNSRYASRIKRLKLTGAAIMVFEFQRHSRRAPAS